jgi:hypothetical protein
VEEIMTKTNTIALIAILVEAMMLPNAHTLTKILTHRTCNRLTARYNQSVILNNFQAVTCNSNSNRSNNNVLHLFVHHVKVLLIALHLVLKIGEIFLFI